jgi:hypothetical protein
MVIYILGVRYFVSKFVSELIGSSKHAKFHDTTQKLGQYAKKRVTVLLQQ